VASSLVFGPITPLADLIAVLSFLAAATSTQGIAVKIRLNLATSEAAAYRQTCTVSLEVQHSSRFSDIPGHAILVVLKRSCNLCLSWISEA
jgi:hypothetical protein